jgi:hypothetical protein
VVRRARQQLLMWRALFGIVLNVKAESADYYRPVLLSYYQTSEYYTEADEPEEKHDAASR